jgi:protein phosphatase
VTDASHFRWTSAARSHAGLVRKLNEDACLDQPERKLWAVADGMGGHTLGDVASRMVVEGLEALPHADSLAQYVADARNCLQAVNQRLMKEAAIRDARVIGSTVVVLLAYDRHCACLWAGDSRIYLCRSGQLMQLTRDHSHIEELIAMGTLNPDEALNHPARNLITRAVGASDTLDLDEETLGVHDGDVFLLCSDGLSNAVSEQEMRSVLVPGDCTQAADALIELALQQGGRDNISVVVVRAEDPDSTDQTVLNPAL